MKAGDILVNDVKGKKYSYDIVLGAINPVEVQVVYKANVIYRIEYTPVDFINKIFENRVSAEDAVKIMDENRISNKELDPIYNDFIENAKKTLISEIENGFIDNFIDKALSYKG